MDIKEYLVKWKNLFIANVIWQKKYSPQNDAEFFSEMHDHILVFSKNANNWRRNLIPRADKQDKAYKNLDDDFRGAWKSSDLTRPEHRDRDFYGIETPSGKMVFPARGRSWSRPKDEIERLRQDNRLWFGRKGDAIPSLKRFLSEVKQGVVPVTLWLRDDVGDNQDAKKEVKEINSNEIFGTPKPERLIQRIINISTNENDLVLDSFLGSGTTAAVAHKMGRRYIGIEMGDHAVTHCAPRLKKVVDGEQGGISQEVNWQGGGGFHFYKLGEAIFNEEGQINPAVKFRALAAHVWFTETHTPLESKDRKSSPLLGIHNGTAYYLLYNGILGDTTKDGGNVLTGKVLASLPPHQGPKVIYGELTTFGSQRLTRENIIFKQVPYDIKAR